MKNRKSIPSSPADLLCFLPLFLLLLLFFLFVLFLLMLPVGLDWLQMVSSEQGRHQGGLGALVSQDLFFI